MGMDWKKNAGLGAVVFMALMLAYGTTTWIDRYTISKKENKYLRLLEKDLQYDLMHLHQLLGDDSSDLLNIEFILERANGATPYDVGEQAFRLLYRTSFVPQRVTYDLMRQDVEVLRSSDLATKYGVGFIYNQLYPQMKASDDKIALHINNFLIPHTINAVGVNDDMMRFSLIRNQSYLNALIMYKVMMEGSIESRKNTIAYLQKVKEDLQAKLD